jgi:serine/threonine protein kinase
MISDSSASPRPAPISTLFAYFRPAAPSTSEVRLRGRAVRYERILLLATGGMGSVFLATQCHGMAFDRFVAMKRAHPAHDDGGLRVRRLRREGALSAGLQHPNLVRTLDLVEAGEESHLVLEYIEGPSLREVLEEEKLGSAIPPPIALSIVRDLLGALQAVHEAPGRDGVGLGLVHGDVAPGNVLLGIDGRARLTDFGLATTGQERRSRAPRVDGTPGYLSPEQAHGEHLDRRTDLFAAGILMFELVTGQRLYQGASRSEIVRHARQGPRRAPAALDAATLPHRLREVCRRALSPWAEDRYASALDFSRALENAAPGIASHDATGRWVIARFGARIRRQQERIAEWRAGSLPYREAA